MKSWHFIKLFCKSLLWSSYTDNKRLIQIFPLNIILSTLVIYAQWNVHKVLSNHYLIIIIFVGWDTWKLKLTQLWLNGSLMCTNQYMQSIIIPNLLIVWVTVYCLVSSFQCQYKRKKICAFTKNWLKQHSNKSTASYYAYKKCS